MGNKDVLATALLGASLVVSGSQSSKAVCGAAVSALASFGRHLPPAPSWVGGGCCQFPVFLWALYNLMQAAYDL